MIDLLEEEPGSRCAWCSEAIEPGDVFCSRSCRSHFMAEERFHAARDEGEEDRDG